MSRLRTFRRHFPVVLTLAGLASVFSTAVSAAGFSLPTLVSNVPAKPVLGYSMGLSVLLSEAEKSLPFVGSLGLESKTGPDSLRMELASSGKEWEVSADWKTRRSFEMVGMVSAAIEGRIFNAQPDLYLPDADKMLYFEGQGALGNILGKLRLSSIGGAYGNSDLISDFRRTSGVGVATRDFLEDHSGSSGFGIEGRYRTSNLLTLIGSADMDWYKDVGKRTVLGLGTQLNGSLPGTLTIKVKDTIEGDSALSLSTEYSTRIAESTTLNAAMGWALTDGVQLGDYSVGADFVGQSWQLGLKLAGERTDEGLILSRIDADLGFSEPKKVNVFAAFEPYKERTLVGARLKF